MVGGRCKRLVPARSAKACCIAGPTWSAGDRVRWQHHTGTYLRDALDEDDLAEILIGQRTYRAAGGTAITGRAGRRGAMVDEVVSQSATAAFRQRRLCRATL